MRQHWAQFGPNNPPWFAHMPQAGVCISVFIIARRRGSILLGRPRSNDAWPTKGGYPKSGALKLERDGSWLLPATHFLVEDSPDEAAHRVTREWAGLKQNPRFVQTQSHLRPRKRGNHWDLCFIYEVSARNPPEPKPWWSEMRFASPSEIRRMNLGRDHRDILEKGGYIKPILDKRPR